MKPGISLQPTTATSVSGTPLLYDSGVKYDDPDAYYDRWYPASDLSQGEIPNLSASDEKIKAVSGVEDIKLDSTQEKVGLGSEQESIIIKNIEEF